MSRLRSAGAGRVALNRVLAVIKRIAGMPNYQAFVDHLRARHPGCPVPTEREYFEDYLRGRYGNGFGRCC